MLERSEGLKRYKDGQQGGECVKKKGLLCAALLLTGCFGGMETITRQDVQEGATQQEWAAVEEVQDTKMVVNDLSGSIESWNRIIDEQGEGIVDLYLPVGPEGQLETRVAYEIHSSDGAASIDGVFLVSVDEQIVPSSIKGGTKQQVHFVKVPLQEAVVDVQVDLSEIDLSYNHGITFHFLYRDENGCSDLSVSKFIGDEENRSYMEYFETLAYPGTVSDDDMQEAIDLYQSNDTSFMLSNVWNYLYTPIFNRGGGLFMADADDSLLQQADAEGVDLSAEDAAPFTELSGTSGSVRTLELRYKEFFEEGRTGAFLIWCDGEWATFDGSPALLYRLDEESAVHAFPQLTLPQEPGTYDLLLINLALNDPQGYAQNYVSCYSVNVVQP